MTTTTLLTTIVSGPFTLPRLAVSALVLALGLAISRAFDTCESAKCRTAFAWRRRRTDDGALRAVCRKCALHLDRMRRAREKDRPVLRS